MGSMMTGPSHHTWNTRADLEPGGLGWGQKVLPSQSLDGVEPDWIGWSLVSNTGRVMEWKISPASAWYSVGWPDVLGQCWIPCNVAWYLMLPGVGWHAEWKIFPCRRAPKATTKTNPVLWSNLGESSCHWRRFIHPVHPQVALHATDL